MNDIIEKDLNIENMIYEIRGKQVMLDSDLAKLYKCANGTKSINLAVKRHINKFPERFMFQLNEEECKMFSRFQFETLNKRGHNIKYLPYVFTEEGVAMLATILRTSVAEQVSVLIMDAFVKMRHYIKDNLLDQQNINNIVLEDHSHILKMDDNLKLLQEAFDKLEDKKRNNELYLEGAFYTSYSRVIDIFNEAKEELIIIDSYADKKLLDMIKDLNIKVIIITKEKSKLNKTLTEEYNKEFHNLKIIYNDSFHDRYYILDKSIIYHSGASINYMGKRIFSINLLSDDITKKLLLDKINEFKI